MAGKAAEEGVCVIDSLKQKGYNHKKRSDNMDKNNDSKHWIEERPNEWTYQLRCPKCGYVYLPKGYEDGTTEHPNKYCPKCGEKLA